MRKVISLISIAIITIVLVGALAYYIGVQGFLFAWALNFLLMVCVLVFTETLKSQHNSPYYNNKAWKQRGKVYESLRI